MVSAERVGDCAATPGLGIIVVSSLSWRSRDGRAIYPCFYSHAARASHTDRSRRLASRRRDQGSATRAYRTADGHPLLLCKMHHYAWRDARLERINALEFTSLFVRRTWFTFG